MASTEKPLGTKSYGTIPHLPGSRLGPKERTVQPEQVAMCTTALPRKNMRVIITEKLDGSNVAVYRPQGDELVPLTRSGYRAESSPHVMHHVFVSWMHRNRTLFLDVLGEGERLCGEWLYQAHGTRYTLPHEPFVAFDLMFGPTRTVYGEFLARMSGAFVTPQILNPSGACAPVSVVADVLGDKGFHGAEMAEGAVWRVEEEGRGVLVLAKWVNPVFEPGKYLNGYVKNHGPWPCDPIC